MMGIEVVSIGNEILSGEAANTNAALISQELLKEGFAVDRHTVLADGEQTLKTGLQEVLSRAKVVLCTGGLDSTCDNPTCHAAANLFDVDLKYGEELAQTLSARFGTEYILLRNQAAAPVKAALIPNAAGTVPGLIFIGDTSTLILMPGALAEMKMMFMNEVLPFLIKSHLGLRHHYIEHIYLCKIPELVVGPFLRILQAQHPRLELCLYPSGGCLLTVSVKALANDAGEAAIMLAPAIESMKKKFHGHIYEAASGKIEEAIQEVLVRTGKTLAVAESCTGGMIASRLTLIAGASNYFLGSVTAYSNWVKEHVLHVDSEILEQKGAVSEETVAEMALGVLKIFQSDYSIAVSGVAGPSGGTVEKPVGMVCMAICGKDLPTYVWTFNAKGARDAIIISSVNEALTTFWLIISQLQGSSR